MIEPLPLLRGTQIGTTLPGARWKAKLQPMHQNTSTVFSDVALSKRLERAEGYACAQYAASRRKLFPDSDAEWIQYAGASVVFDGVDSPVTQTFGLGLFEELTPAALDAIEKFYLDRAAPIYHEISPFAGIATMDLLCRRNYRPVEISNVLYRQVERPTAELPCPVNVRVIGSGEIPLWSDVSARGWAHEHPELMPFLLELGTIIAARQQSLCFLAESDGQPGAAGVLLLHEGVALLGGAATVPELRRRGLQSALLQERLRYAFEHGCDLAMMVAEAGSNSQRNAERKGFRVAYTRMKWKLGG
jgi:GNAT superfamily N-acetyltransferase